jgi:DNA-binding MarR family transcriptional regulator
VYGTRLNRAIRLIGMKHRGQATKALGKLGLHPGREVLLLELDARGPRTQAELAGALGCEPPSVTVMVQKLEAAGLLKRSPSASDGRATVVELTGRGCALMPKLKEVWLRLAEATVVGLSETSVESLLQALGDLATSLYPRRPGREPAGRRGGPSPQS